MDKLFLTILNMSLTGAFVIAAICLARLPLRKTPKIISYCLWAVAGFRLTFPFSIESMLSLIPFNAAPIPTDIAMQAVPNIDSGIPVVNEFISGALPTAAYGASVNPLQTWTAIGGYVWLAGIAAMLIYGVLSYIILKRNMSKSVCVEANIYQAENIKSPFVLGVIRPKIYLPSGLTERERTYIILHEQTHIRRRDHVVKFIAYFILCLHWFNPLAWIAFLLMSVDMEMSCDERVLKEISDDTKKDYSMLLLSLATQHRFVGVSPLAFGEGGVKQRIKNVLSFRKPSRVIITLAIALAVTLGIGLALSRVSGADDAPSPGLIYDAPEPNDDVLTADGTADDDGDDTETTQIAAPDNGVPERMVFSSLEDAYPYLPFPIMLPSVLPANAGLDEVLVMPAGGEYYAHGTTITYRLEVDDAAWNHPISQYASAQIILIQLNLGSSASAIFWDSYNNAPHRWEHEPTDPPGVYLESMPIMMGGTEAVLSGYYLPELLGIEPHSDDSKVHASISWYRGDVMYQISAFAPAGTIDLEMLIAIAESLK